MSASTMDGLSLRATDPALRQRYLAEGQWTDSVLGGMLLGWLRDRPDHDFRVWSHHRPQRTRFGAVADLALRLAGGLQRRGIRPGDAVCIYVPNSVEGAIGFISVPLVGAVVVPVAPFYGLKELEFILRRSGARILITAGTGAGERLEGIAALRRSLPALEDVYVIGAALPAGMRPFEDLLAPDAMQHLPAVDPDAVAAIAFTSGTTSDAKGVIHTHRSICCEVQSHMILTPWPRRPTLVGGPISHVTGMLLGLFLPPLRKNPVHLIDGWDATLALQALRECDLSTGSGATIFLNSILNHPDITPADIARIETASVGGAMIPDAWMEQLHALGIRACRSYGSTEHPTVTYTHVTDPEERRLHADGHAMPGCEMRIVDEDGRDLGPGQPGEVWSRGPDLCAGYVDAAMTADTFTADGWYRSGDIGVVDEAGYLTITDRLKDIIVRNGVKVSAVEVENVLLQMPGLQEVAVVAAPNARTGEQGHAFLRPAPGVVAPTLDEVRMHLQRADLARQKWPESLEVVEDFPRTASGKVRKVDLRQALRARSRS